MLDTKKLLPRGLCLAGLISCLGTGLPLQAAAEAADPHAHHRHMLESSSGFVRTQANYALPEIRLVRADGATVDFRAELDDGRPVVLNFIYTTCTAICPMLSQTFAAFQDQLGEDAAQVHMVSVSIDPEQDTPERLLEYAQRYHAGPQWHHYTGTLDASIEVQKAFESYYVDKMNHRPVVFMRAAPGSAWVRLEGFTTPDDLVREYRQLQAAG